MKRNIIFSAIITILGLAIISDGQTTGTFRLTFNGQTTGALQTTTFKFTGQPNTNIRLFEAVIPARSDAECFASTDFSNATPIGPDRAIVDYDDATGMYKVIWINQSENRESCRVLRGSGDIDGRDFLVWQRGASVNPALAEGNEIEQSGTADSRQSAPRFVYLYQVVAP